MLLSTSAVYKASGTANKKYTLARMCATADEYLSVLSDVYTELTSKPLLFMVKILSEQLDR